MAKSTEMYIQESTVYKSRKLEKKTKKQVSSNKDYFNHVLLYSGMLYSWPHDYGDVHLSISKDIF